MTHQERRDITHLYEQTPHGVLFTLVESRETSSQPLGVRMYATADARHAGNLIQDGLPFTTMHAGDEARMHEGVLLEHGSTPEAAALMEAYMSALAGEHRIVATLLPEGDITLLRFVMDERGDVLFASDLLETENIVPLRRFARTSAHGVIHVSSQGRLFVERMDVGTTEERIIEHDTPYAEAE